MRFWLAAGCSSYEPDLPVRHWVVRVGVEHDDGKGQQVGAVGCTWRQFRHSGWEAVKGKLGEPPQSSANNQNSHAWTEYGMHAAHHGSHSHRKHAVAWPASPIRTCLEGGGVVTAVSLSKLLHDAVNLLRLTRQPAWGGEGWPKRVDSPVSSVGKQGDGRPQVLWLDCTLSQPTYNILTIHT